MSKISTINADVFQYGDGKYPKGDYVPQFRTVSGKLAARLKNKATGEFMDGSSRFTPWDQFTDSDDEAFASADAFSTALANIIVKADPLDTIANDRGAVTQATNKTTAVSSNTHMTVITTVDLSDAADTAFSFTFNNDKLTSGRKLFASCNMNGGTGKALITVTESVGSAVITVTNVGTAAFSEPLIISTIVI